MTRIVVTHHTFDAPNSAAAPIPAHKPVGRADMAMAGLIGAGVDLILSGHLHLSGVIETTRRFARPCTAGHRRF